MIRSRKLAEVVAGLALKRMMTSLKIGLLLASLLAVACSASAQQASPGENPSGVATAGRAGSTKSAASVHKFWDGENVALFAGVAAVRALDFTSTQHFRERGVNEILLTNSIVDNKPLFATIEVAGTAASIAVSYALHRTGHHRAERWVSIVHIGVGTFGDIRNYGLSNPQFTGTRH